MSHIDIRRCHDLDHERARAAAENVARELDEEFELDYRWHGDVLYFSRPGVEGRLEVLADEVRVVAKLGLLLLPFRARFEHEIHRFLDALFGQA